MQTGGIGINLTTKRGTNALPRRLPASWSPRRPVVEQRARQSSATTRACGGSDKADHIQQITDYGFDLGGPIVKDKLVVLRDLRQAGHPAASASSRPPTRPCCPRTTASSTGRRPASTMLSAFYFLGSKQKFGRDVGLRAEPRPTTSSGTRTMPTRRAGFRAASGSWRSTTRSRRTSSSRAKAAYYDTGFGFAPRRRRPKTYHARLRRRRGDRLLPVTTRRSGRRRPSTSTATTSSRAWRQQRAEVRLRLPRPDHHPARATTRATGLGGYINDRRQLRGQALARRPARTTAASTSRPTWATCSPRIGSR